MTLLWTTPKKRNAIVSGIVLIITIAIGLFYNVPYWFTQWRDPILLSNDVMLNIEAPTTLYNVAVNADDIITEIGSYILTTEEGSDIDYYHALFLTDDAALLLFTEDRISSETTFHAGTLMPIDDETWQEIIRPIDDNYSIDFLPIMLDTRNENYLWYFGTGAILLSIIVSIWQIKQYFDWRRLRMD